MAVDITIPPLSQTMDTVILVQWLKAVGDEVVNGEPLFVIETDKANLDVESPATGILRRIIAEPGTEVKVRSKIGVIASPDEIIPQGPGPKPTPEPKAAQPLPTATGPGGQPLPPEQRNRIFASPRARRLAQQEEVLLAEVTATGPQQMIVEQDVRAYLEARRAAPEVTPVARRVAEAVGLNLTTVVPARPGARITRADVEAALAKREAVAPAGIQWVDLSPTRRTIARRMAESQQAAAEVTLTREVDATELVHLRERILEELSERDRRPAYNDFLVSIVARQLKQHPYVNATTNGERIGLSEEVHVAVAVDTERGLVTPVVRNADQKGLLQLAQERAELVRRALDGSITPEELGGGTFTITNLGTLGVDAFTPIINPPQVAILGVGRIRSAPAVHKEELCVRQLMYLSLTFNHRFIDGAPAARFLADVVRLIEKPHLLWLDVSQSIP